MIVATHDLPMVRELLPRTLVMDGGLLVADGPDRRVSPTPPSSMTTAWRCQA